MDTRSKISALAGSYEMRVIGIPKTIDNDLEHTDHCPALSAEVRGCFHDGIGKGCRSASDTCMRHGA